MPKIKLKKSGSLSKDILRAEITLLRQIQRRINQDEKTVKEIKERLSKHLSAVKRDTILEDGYKVHLIRPERYIWDEEGLRSLLTNKRAIKLARKKGLISEGEKLDERAVTTITRVEVQVDKGFVESLLQQGILTKEQVADVLSIQPLTAWVRVDEVRDGEDE